LMTTDLPIVACSTGTLTVLTGVKFGFEDNCDFWESDGCSIGSGAPCVPRGVHYWRCRMRRALLTLAIGQADYRMGVRVRAGYGRTSRSYLLSAGHWSRRL